MKLRNLVSTVAAVSSLAIAQPVLADGTAGTAQIGTAHDFTFERLDGTELSLADHAGEVVLVVNTASLCGFTPQYEGLEALYQSYRAQGFTVVGVPSNDFGGQEPGSAEEIAHFCRGILSVTFPLAAKTTVKGDRAHPFYRWARTTLGAGAAPRWNFHKYLVGRDGKLLAAFPSTVRPQSKKLTDAVEQALRAGQS